MIFMDDFPEQGEIVIGRISKVLDYGVFLDLLEYEGVQGFVHISNVSSSWVKNIRNFVKEGQIRAGKVIHVDKSKKQVDVSLNKVSPNAQRAKIEEYKQAKRAQKLLELLAEKQGVSFDVVWSEVAEPLLQNYDSLFDAFQAVLLKGGSAVSVVPKKWVGKLVELVRSNYSLPVKVVRGKVSVFVPGSNGVELVKKALSAGEKVGGSNVSVFYEGSGVFGIRVSSSDYKSAEKLLKSVSDTIVSSVSSFGGKAVFERVEE